MGSQVALVKGNRQMGFQVDRATHVDFGSGQRGLPKGISVYPNHTQVLVLRQRRLPKGISVYLNHTQSFVSSQKGLVKGILINPTAHLFALIRRNSRMGFLAIQVGGEWCRNFRFVFLYNTYYSKSLLRKYYKEGASIVTHFWVPT